MASRLTDAQLRSAIASSAATKAKHQAAGNDVLAGAAHARMVKNQAELDRRTRENESSAPAGAAAEAPASLNQLPPRVVPDDAVRSAEALIAKWGPGGAVNALAQALANKCAAYAQSADVADGVRMLQMKRRYVQ